MHKRGSIKERGFAGYFLGPRWSPFRSAITVNALRVTITNRGSGVGLHLIAAGITFTGVGIVMIIDSIPLRYTSPPAIWVATIVIGCVLFIAGVCLARSVQRCDLDTDTLQATFTFRGPLGTKTWTAPFDALELLTHPVSLHRKSPWPSWNGYALCIWHLDDLAMVIATSKKRETCDQILAEGGPILQALHAGTGELLTANF
jgi:hypothetical protein